MIKWSLMALSTQIGYIVPLVSMLQLNEVKLTRKLTMLRVENTYNKPSQQITLQSGLCRGNPSTQKIL